MLTMLLLISVNSVHFGSNQFIFYQLRVNLGKSSISILLYLHDFVVRIDKVTNIRIHFFASC